MKNICCVICYNPISSPPDTIYHRTTSSNHGVHLVVAAVLLTTARATSAATAFIGTSIVGTSKLNLYRGHDSYCNTSHCSRSISNNESNYQKSMTTKSSTALTTKVTSNSALLFGRHMVVKGRTSTKRYCQNETKIQNDYDCIEPSGSDQQQQQQQQQQKQQQQQQSSSSSAIKEGMTSLFTIRQATMNDLASISSIVTHGFFANDTNIVTYQIEKLKTYLSLEACFPQQPELHHYLVATTTATTTAAAASTSKKRKVENNTMLFPTRKKLEKEIIIGFIEIDCRPIKETKITATTTKTTAKLTSLAKVIKRPYMCNLSIDPKWQKKGVATALIQSSEALALEVGLSSEIWLKVRSSNVAAVGLYEKLGYDIHSSERIIEDNKKKPKETVLMLMKKEIMACCLDLTL